MSDQAAADDPAGAPAAMADPAASSGIAASHPLRIARPLVVAPTTDGDFNALSLDLVAVACVQLPDLLFEFDSSFPMPGIAEQLKAIATLREQHRSAAGLAPPLSLFGHADPSGNDDYNKLLSGRRAMAIYGVLTRDLSLWNFLFDNPHGGDDWSAKKAGATMRAVLGLPQATPRPQLMQAYMDLLSPVPIEKDAFLGKGADPKGKGDFQGCSEFNPLLLLSSEENATLAKAERNFENASNRRVIIFMFRPGSRIDTARWPCPTALAGVADCKKRFFAPPRTGDVRRAPGDERREFARTLDTFACRFYDRIARLSPCELPLPLPPPLPIDAVSPLLAFALTESTAVTATAAGTAAGAIGPATRTVVVRKPHALAARIDVELKTDKPFDGKGSFIVSPADKITFFLGSK